MINVIHMPGVLTRPGIYSVNFDTQKAKRRHAPYSYRWSSIHWCNVICVCFTSLTLLTRVTDRPKNRDEDTLLWQTGHSPWPSMVEIIIFLFCFVFGHSSKFRVHQNRLSGFRDVWAGMAKFAVFLRRSLWFMSTVCVCVCVCVCRFTLLSSTILSCTCCLYRLSSFSCLISWWPGTWDFRTKTPASVSSCHVCSVIDGCVMIIVGLHCQTNASVYITSFVTCILLSPVLWRRRRYEWIDTLSGVRWWMKREWVQVHRDKLI